MEDGNLLDFGQTGVIVVNHVMEDLDGEHEKGAVPTQVQSMAGKTVLGPIQKQLLKHATHLLVLVCTKHYNYVFTCPSMFFCNLFIFPRTDLYIPNSINTIFQCTNVSM